MLEFECNIEQHLLDLANDLNSDKWVHGDYRQFETSKGKKRLVSVASLRDRVVNRLIYEYMSKEVGSMFLYNAWSGRKGKGLLGAIRRAQEFARRFRDGWVVKLDVRKFFDSVRHDYLNDRVRVILSDTKALGLCKAIIDSFNLEKGVGMPIGNVTSQIFANVYLHDIDVFISRNRLCLSFVRYGDDILMFVEDLNSSQKLNVTVIESIEALGLGVNAKSSYIRKVKHGFDYLGCVIYPKGRHLSRAMRAKTLREVNYANIASYSDLWKKHDKQIVFELNQTHA